MDNKNITDAVPDQDMFVTDSDDNTLIEFDMANIGYFSEHTFSDREIEMKEELSILMWT
jgi:hypothetical protein